MVNNASPFGVYNEWGKLKEVLVGDNACDTAPRWSLDRGRYHGCEKWLKGLEGVPLRQAFPERARGANEQTEALAKVLQDHGVIVHCPRLLTDAEIASSSLPRPATAAVCSVLLGRRLASQHA
jgi:hypothetical protein